MVSGRGSAALLALMALAASASCIAQSSSTVSQLRLDTAEVEPVKSFEEWAAAHGRTYLNDPVEKAQRYSQFLETVVRVGAYKRANADSTMKLGLNGFADWSDDEFRTAYLGQRAAPNPLLRAAKQVSIGSYVYAQDELVNEVDWRTKGIVGPIKNQHPHNAPCGCCWTFATTAITECINAMYTGKVVSLSEQQLIDCDHAPPFEDAGCKGGDFTGGLHYIITNGGINTEEAYPYVHTDNTCNKTLEEGRVVTLDSWEVVPPGNETALQQAVARHPVAVGMCVGPGDNILSWRAYTGGIFDGPSCETPIDHAMIVVGYGTEDGKDFWIVKNSWGEEFGEKGYIRFPKGKGGFGYNSIAHEPAYPVKLHPNPKSAADAAAAVDLQPVTLPAAVTAQS